MDYRISAIEEIRSELSKIVEDSLLIERAEGDTDPKKKREKQIAQVLAMILNFVNRVRAGGWSAATAKRKLLNIIAMVISLGLGSVGIIIRALTEAKYLFEKCFKDHINIAEILGVSLGSLDNITDPNSLLFLTMEELGHALPESAMGISKKTSMIDTILLQSRIRAREKSRNNLNIEQAPPASKYSPVKVNIRKGQQVNHLQDAENAG
ncbi:hypothetical protein ACFL4D_03225, partial [Candidatus Margulisiibacteriota bacterium]